eukprot:Amastigsp_a345351_13.p5 type:complete len:104 gc:universal Amastigsp_a345351_13:202-513(+)
MCRRAARRFSAPGLCCSCSSFRGCSTTQRRLSTRRSRPPSLWSRTCSNRCSQTRRPRSLRRSSRSGSSRRAPTWCPWCLRIGAPRRQCLLRLPTPRLRRGRLP